MKEKEFMSRLKELYLPPTDEFVIVNVPALRYAVIDGKGGPGGKAHAHAIKWLFAAVYPIKRIARERMGKSFVEAPLEGLWWADDVEDFISGKKDKLKWRMMIVLPDWVCGAHEFKKAVATAAKELGDAPGNLRLERYKEGKSVQFMHVGPPGDARPTLQRLHKNFLPEHGLAPNGFHHEVYLNDPGRVAPEKLKTVFRQPVRRVPRG